MTGHNRDFQKIADTEIQNAMNNSYLLDEVYHAGEGEKVYFQRVEIIDENTCQFCKRMHGKIVLWSDHPLPDDRIEDPIADFAIWDGKDWDGQKDFIANGVFHPYCRGNWTKYYDSGVDALIAHTKNQSQIYNMAIDTAREEFKEKGIANPTETTPGFTDRVNEVFNQRRGEEIVEKAYNPNQPRDGRGRWAEGPDAGGLGGSREPWDSSTGKANELKAEDWGTPGEIAEMARMEREAPKPEKDDFGLKKFRKEVTQILKHIRSNGPLTNKFNIQLRATLSADSMKKLISDKALDESYSKEAHWLAVCNVDKLFYNAIEPWQFELDTAKNNQDLKERHYLYAPMKYNNDIIPVKLTVKEFTDENRGTRLYSVEAINEVLDIKKGRWSSGDGVLNKSSLSAPARHPYNHNIAHVFDSVNAYLAEPVKKSFSAQVYEALGMEKPRSAYARMQTARKSVSSRVFEAFDKSLTWSGYELEDRYKFAGFNISVENKRGSIRRGTDKDGHEWQCKMFFDYGYIRGTEGVDGDHVDVYIGPHEEAQSVYIVHQNDPVTGKYDEDKVMLGFSSLHDARAAYLKQYDRPGFLGKIDVMPIEEFREKVLSKQYHGKMVKSYSERVLEALGRKS
jgi:hypothetical protein